jgi:hypothetical protein
VGHPGGILYTLRKLDLVAGQEQKRGREIGKRVRSEKDILVQRPVMASAPSRSVSASTAKDRMGRWEIGDHDMERGRE